MNKKQLVVMWLGAGLPDCPFWNAIEKSLI